MIGLLVALAFTLGPTNGRDMNDVAHPVIVLMRAQLLYERRQRELTAFDRN